jgi:DNA adenine methylase
LIECYNQIKNNPDEFIKECQLLERLVEISPELKKTDGRIIIPVPKNLEEARCSRTHLYYYFRNEYNQIKIPNMRSSVLFLYLNKAGFRGLYRENSSGEFNVPYGNYKKVQLVDVNNIIELHKLFQKVEFQVKNFQEFDVKDLSESDFIYLDPPYFPLDLESSFTSYTGAVFSHQDVVDLCKKIPCRFLLSNAKTEWTIRNYSEWNIEEILCRRGIDSSGRKVYEILVIKI